MCIYGLICIHFQIFCIYDITGPYRLLNSSARTSLLFWSSVWCDFIRIHFHISYILRPFLDLYDLMSYHISFINIPLIASPHFFLYLICVFIIPNTPLWSLYVYWFQGPDIHIILFLIPNYLISLISVFIGMMTTITSLNFSMRLSCAGLVMKSPIIPFVGQQSTFNYFLLVRSVIKKKRMLMCLVRLLLDDSPFFSRRIALKLSW